MQQHKFKNAIITHDWLETPLKLRMLQLCKSNVLNIENDAFNSKPFEYLEVFEIIDTPVSVLKTYSLNGLLHLRVFRMQFVKINQIYKNVLSPVPNLEEFILDNCGERLIHLNNLFGNIRMEHLEMVEITNCNLKNAIQMDTFLSLSNIMVLNLNNNQIEEIAPGAFDPIFNSLEALYLESNQLTTIPKEMFKPIDIDRVVRVYIEPNPLRCSCEMDHFVELLQQPNQFQFTLMLCKTSKISKIVQYARTSLCDEDDAAANEVDHTSDNDRDLAQGFNAFSSTELPSEREIPSNLLGSNLQESNPPNSPNSPFPSISTADDYKVSCDFSQSIINGPSVVILKEKSSFHIHTDNEQLLINADFTDYNFRLIEFESKGRTTKVSCFGIVGKTFIKNSKKFQIKRKFKSNHLYRFCMIDKQSRHITTLDCLTLFAFEFETDIEPWLLVKDKRKVITSIVVISVFVLAFGGLVAVLLKIKFPTLILGTEAEHNKATQAKNTDAVVKDGQNLTAKQNEAKRGDRKK